MRDGLNRFNRLSSLNVKGKGAIMVTQVSITGVQGQRYNPMTTGGRAAVAS